MKAESAARRATFRPSVLIEQSGEGGKETKIRAMSKETEDQLIEREQSIVAAHQRGDVEAVETVLAEGFYEIGSSGRLFSKAEILQASTQIKILEYSFERFRVFSVDEQHAIVTYVARTRRRYQGVESTTRTYRSSMWKLAEGQWRLIFHQGTPLASTP
jgi:glyoxylase I family protein